MPQPTTQHIDLDKIRIDGGTQFRAISEDTIQHYAEQMDAGDEFPPLVLYFDGDTYWLADGFQRYHAARRAQATDFPCIVHTGTQRDAVLYALTEANKTHGLHLSNADKRRRVEALLNDAEWGKWADREIARRCGVSATFVGDIRRAICPRTTDAPVTANRGGTAYQMRPPARPEAPRTRPDRSSEPARAARPERSAPPSRPQRSRPEPEPEKPVVKDGRGKPIDDEKAAEAIGQAPRFTSLINELHDIKRRVLELAKEPIGAEIRGQDFAREIKNAVTAIRFGIPYAPCPFMPNCTRKGGCKHCGGRRWLTQEVFDRLPKEVRR